MDFTATHSANEIIRSEIFKSTATAVGNEILQFTSNKNGRRRAGEASFSTNSLKSSCEAIQEAA